MKGITKEEAIEVFRKSPINFFMGSVQQLHPEQITDEPPSGCYLATEHYEAGCWFIPCPTFGSRPTIKAGCPVVGISKKTGEIIFSGIVGA